MKAFDSVIRFITRYKWPYRGVWFLAMAFLTWQNVRRGFEEHWTFLDYLGNGLSILLIGTVLFFWWRMDLLDEFERHVRDAIGAKGNLVIFAVRMQLRTTSIWKLNQVMRRYDVMNTPKLDLPPEAHELREILEDALTK